MRVILFNLYPYRLLRENRRKRRVVAELSAGAALGLMLCWGITQEFSQRLAEKQAFLAKLAVMEAEVTSKVDQVRGMKDRVAVLKRQVSALQAIEKESVLASQWVSYLDGTVPANVSLTRLSVTDGLIVLNGFTSAVSSLAQWVDQMEAGTSLFDSVELVSVTESTGKAEGQSASRHLFEVRALVKGVGHAAR